MPGTGAGRHRAARPEQQQHHILGGGHSRFGTIGAMESAGIHYVYVKRKDRDAAEEVARQVLR